MRPRKTRTDLPPCVYLSHGSYYLVKHNKWTNLGRDKHSALVKYASIISSPRHSVSDALSRFLCDCDGKVSTSTLRSYKGAAKRLSEAFREFGIDQVKPVHIAQFMDHHRDKPNTANRMLSVLSQALDIAVRAGQCESNPCASIKRFSERKRDRYLTDAEFAAIHAAAGKPLQQIMDAAYLTGQRIGDVLAIKLADISADGIEFRQQKSGKRILVAMNDDLAAVVNDAKRQIKRITPYLLAQRNGKIRSYRGVRDLFARACERAGIEDVHLHDIRAKSLTDAKQQGLNAQVLGGHSTEAMTNRYLRSRETITAAGPSFRHLIGSEEKQK